MGRSLLASEETYNSIVGAFISGITVSVYSGEVIEANPAQVFFSQYELNRIENLLFLVGYNLDLSFLTEYSLRIGWSSSGYTSSLVTIPQDLTNASDPLNYLSLEGFIGLPILPGAIINPLENLVLTYQLASQEPSLQITKSVSNASKLAFSLPTLTTLIKNIGSYPVWGLPFNLTVFGITNDPRTNVISNYIMSQTGLTISAGLIQALAQNGHPWSTLFPNVLPRIFLIDTLGTGIPNNFYPDLSFLTSALESLVTNDTTAGLTAALEFPTGIALFAPYGVTIC